MNMKTKERIAQLFNNLDIWIGLPKYQAERRLDVFFGLYMEDILKECRSDLFAEEDQLILVPEFPLQKNKSNNECTNIDYLVFNITKKCVHAIELKTDTHSVDDDQIDYYGKFKHETSLEEPRPAARGAGECGGSGKRTGSPRTAASAGQTAQGPGSEARATAGAGSAHAFRRSTR